MTIVIDDQYRHSPRYENHLNVFCEKLEKHFKDIPIFDAAMQFYKEYFLIRYFGNHNGVACGAIE